MTVRHHPTLQSVVSCGQRYYLCCDDGTAWIGTTADIPSRAPTLLAHHRGLLPYGWWAAIDTAGHPCAINPDTFAVEPLPARSNLAGPVVAAAATQFALYVIDDRGVTWAEEGLGLARIAGATYPPPEFVQLPIRAARAVAATALTAFAVDSDAQLWTTGFTHGDHTPTTMTAVALDAPVATISAGRYHCAIVDSGSTLHIATTDDTTEVCRVDHPHPVAAAYANEDGAAVFIDARGDIHHVDEPGRTPRLVGHLPAGTRPIGFGGLALWAVDRDGHPWVNGRISGARGTIITNGFVQLPHLGTPEFALLAELIDAAPPGTALAPLVDATHRL